MRDMLSGAVISATNITQIQTKLNSNLEFFTSILNLSKILNSEIIELSIVSDFLKNS